MDTQRANAVVEKHRVGAITHLTISGVIDETFSPQATASDLRGHVVVDLGRIQRISSFGVRKWIEFVGQLPAGTHGMWLIHAPPIMADQLNLVDGFCGAAKLVSLLAPYRCASCSQDRLRLVSLPQDAEVLATGAAPTRTCTVCEAQLEFSDLPEEFFDFASRQSMLEVDAGVARYLKMLSADHESELASPIKIIEGDVSHVTMASHLRGDLNVRRLAAGMEGRVVFDFAHVSRVEPEAVPKLLQMLDAAAQAAEVFLCRVTPAVLFALEHAGRTVPAKLATLRVPLECSTCGSRTHATMEVSTLARQEGGSTCAVCGEQAHAPTRPSLVAAASALPSAEGPTPIVEELESRALSQYLFGSANPDPGTGKIAAADATPTGAQKLQIIRRIGQGGMAEVFLARQLGVKGFEKFVVMKKILSQFAESQEFVEMLFAEARANARLTHPNIVQTFDAGVMDGVAYITMEYVRGPDLKRLLKELARKKLQLPIEHALRIVAETAAGLHYAHSYVDPSGMAHPMVHRDVSPHNVLVSLDGAIKLSDFGIAKVQGEDRTEAGVIKGKISYLSPEAACGRPLDARNDVFALGVVLFELLTGTLPFKRDHDAATLNAIVREAAPNPTDLNGAIPQDVSDVVLRALVKDPSRRTPTAAAVREELEAVMARHRMASSPFAVAQYFRETLADKLSEYAPSGSGTGSNNKIAAARGSESARAAVRGTGTPSRPNATPPGPSGTPSRPSGTPPRPAGTPPRSGMTGTAQRPPPPFGGTPAQGSSTTERPTPLGPPASLRTPPPARPPAVTTPAAPARPVTRPSQPSLQRVEDRAPATQGGGSGGRPAVAPGSAREPSAPPPAVSRSERPPVPLAASASRGRLSLVLALGAVALLAGVGVLAMRGDGSQIVGLAEGEHLYVDGRRVESDSLPPVTGGPALVATAQDGKLKRFGTVSSVAVVDVRTIPEAAVQQGSKGGLRVTTSPSECRVEIDKVMKSDVTTPVRLEIDAAREIELTVYCSQRQVWSTWVMAVPNQEIEIQANLH